MLLYVIFLCWVYDIKMSDFFIYWYINIGYLLMVVILLIMLINIFKNIIVGVIVLIKS